MDKVKEKELFETMPVHKAVATLAIPSIISQIVSIIYNLADTFYIGPWIMQAFIQEEQTGILGAEFLRIACLAVPFTAVNALIIYTLQAMGKGASSTILTICRQGLLNIPCLLLMNWLVGLYGMIWTQLIIEVLMLPVTIGMYMVTWKKLTK